MADILVTASTGALNSLLGKLTTLMGEEFAKLKNLRRQVEFISDELSHMKDVLDMLANVDELDPQTKRWRDKVREMSYDTEDIIDDFIHYIGKKNEKSRFVRKTIRRLKTCRARHRIAGQIEEIKTLARETSEQRQRYKVDIPITTSRDHVNIDSRVVSLYKSAVNLVAMEGPTVKLVNWLIDEDKNLKVVSVVGFGGLGKTTLANQVLHKLKGEFQFSAFVPVSQKPNIPRLLRSLLTQLGIQQSFADCELHVLLDKLREHLQEKRYFIIIDDIWDGHTWDIIKYAFPENDLGSRIIATTRIQDVARACCSPHQQFIFQMEPLSDKDSRKLFFHRIFGSEEACPDHLRNVSVEILKKCAGLPLAIISISSLLASEGPNQRETRWEYVRKSLGSMSGTKLTLQEMREILNLSYKNLPCHLKTCFLYIGMYPEDYTIDRSDLERQWIAEGFISATHGRDVQKYASTCFNELVNKSLVQPVHIDWDGSVKSCKVHDMMLDLILIKCEEENFMMVVEGEVKEAHKRARRLSFGLDGANNGIPEDMGMSQVRSVAIFRRSPNLPAPLSQFRFLRVFVAEFSSGIVRDQKVDLTGLSKLYQLQFLKIKGSGCQLPPQIRGLQLLETIDLDADSIMDNLDADSIEDNIRIPSDITHLQRLLHLRVRYGAINNVGKMAPHLRSLEDFFVGKMISLDSIKSLGELVNLTTLSVYINLDGMDETKVTKHMDVLCSSLGKLSSLQYLEVKGMWGRIIDDLSALSPPLSLEKLRFWDCYFSRVPNWMGELHNLSDLKLIVSYLHKDGVRILAELLSLAQLELHILGSGSTEEEIYGFPVLKRCRLSSRSLSYLTFLPGAMPKIKSLSIGFNAEGSEERAPIPAGIEHLLALEEFSADVGCAQATEAEWTIAESALRSAINMLPNHPRVEIKRTSNMSYIALSDILML